MKPSGNPFALQSVRLPRWTIGGDAYSGVADLILPLGNRALLIAGNRALAAGYEELRRTAGSRGVFITVSPYTGEPTLERARELAQTAREAQACVILGMGGGRAIDAAKAAAYYAQLPVITLPTIAATCAAVTALSVVHHPTGAALSPFLFLNGPPLHAFLHTGILAASPAQYLRAGIGDSIAKHVESAFKAQNADLRFEDRLGLAIAAMGYESLLSFGHSAYSDARRGLDSPDFRLVCEVCIVNTGLVSLLVRESFNGGLAHALYYALRDEKPFSGLLHGDLVAWGSLVQLMLEGKEGEARRLAAYLKALEVAAGLREMGLMEISPALEETFKQALYQQDMAEAPWFVEPDALLAAIHAVERFAR